MVCGEFEFEFIRGSFEYIGIVFELVTGVFDILYIGIVGHSNTNTLFTQDIPVIDGGYGRSNDSFFSIGQTGVFRRNRRSIDKMRNIFHSTIDVPYDGFQYDFGIVCGFRELNTGSCKDGLFEFSEYFG